MILNLVDMGWLAFSKNRRCASYGANVKERSKTAETLPPLVNDALAATSRIRMLQKVFLNF
jgi:hypothetical protein